MKQLHSGPQDRLTSLVNEHPLGLQREVFLSQMLSLQRTSPLDVKQHFPHKQQDHEPCSAMWSCLPSGRWR